MITETTSATLFGKPLRKSSIQEFHPEYLTV